MTSKAKTVSMCVVRIDLTDLVMPLAAGLKVVELLQGSVICERSYQLEPTYQLGDQPRTELTTVKPSQLRFRSGTPFDQPAAQPAQRRLR